MPSSQYGDLKVRAKTREVKEYHQDETRPGKPLYLLIPGGLLALASLGLIVYLLYLTLLEGSIETDLGFLLVALLAPVYVGSVFVFSYGYELYDVGRALRLTAIIVFLTLSIVIIIAVLLVLLGGSSKKSGGRSAKSASGGGILGGLFAGNQAGSRRTSSRRISGIDVVIPNISIGGRNTVTREVIREVPVKPPELQPVKCNYCGRAFIPKETKYACPACGASATPEQIAASEVEFNESQSKRAEE